MIGNIKDLVVTFVDLYRFKQEQSRAIKSNQMQSKAKISLRRGNDHLKMLNYAEVFVFPVAALTQIENAIP